MKMKNHMTSHVDEHRQTMFKESTEVVKDLLKQMCRKVEEEMSNKADEVFVLMRRDYMTVISGAHMPQGQVMPKAERIARAEIAKIIKDREKEASKGEDEDEDEADKNSEMYVDETQRGERESNKEAELGNESKDEVVRKRTDSADEHVDEADPFESTNDTEKAIQDELNEQIKDEN